MTIEHLVFYSDFGPVYGDSTPEDAAKQVALAAALHQTTEEDILAQLAQGQEIEHELTDWESTPCKIRDKEVHQHRVAQQDEAREKHEQALDAKCGTYTCKECGASGRGGAYPFSTAPGSGYCDDCL